MPKMYSVKSLFLMATLVIMTVLTSGCQQDARHYGGSSTIDLPAGKKLVPYTVQWDRNANIWYLTEDAEPGYQPKTYEFKESSNLGVMEGTLTFVEHKAGDIVPTREEKKNETAEQAKKILENQEGGLLKPAEPVGVLKPPGQNK